MKRVLVTGFTPFDGQIINPSWEAVKNLPDNINDKIIIKHQIPTVFDKAPLSVIKKATELNVNAIICVGQAGGRFAITPEVVGLNLKEASIPDNEGNMPQNVPINKNSPVAYFSTIPVREIVSAINAENIPCTLSYSAGAFVCNNTLYYLLDYFKNTDIQVGFIHVPFLPEQAKNNQPSLPLESITRALEIAISTLFETQNL